MKMKAPKTSNWLEIFSPYFRFDDSADKRISAISKLSYTTNGEYVVDKMQQLAEVARTRVYCLVF